MIMMVQITRYIIIEQDEAIIFTGFYLSSSNREVACKGANPVATYALPGFARYKKTRL